MLGTTISATVHVPMAPISPTMIQTAPTAHHSANYVRLPPPPAHYALSLAPTKLTCWALPVTQCVLSNTTGILPMELKTLANHVTAVVRYVLAIQLRVSNAMPISGYTIILVEVPVRLFTSQITSHGSASNVQCGVCLWI